jgi:hypothetical protein
VCEEFAEFIHLWVVSQASQRMVSGYDIGKLLTVLVAQSTQVEEDAGIEPYEGSIELIHQEHYLSPGIFCQKS